MSLLGTLAKVAVGVAVAKGVGHMVQQGRSGGGRSPSGGMLAQAKSATGGIEDMLGQVLGGRTAGGAAGNGGLGGLMDSLTGKGGGLDDVLQGLTGKSGGLSQMLAGLGGAGGASGGLADMLGGLTSSAGAGGALGGLMGALGGQQAAPNPGFGTLLNEAVATQSEPPVPPSPAQEAAAGLMLRAMILAARSDGKIDEAERARLLDRLGDISAAERQFVNDAMEAPVDAGALAAITPGPLAQQVYAMSVMGLDLDAQAEAQYLHDLADALGIGRQQVNQIHAQLGAPPLYA